MRNNEREPMNTNATKKEILAKLLATEDITVIQKNVETASFNLESRTLTLPTWKTMDSDTIDHLTGHEVGHALYTPELEWKKAVENKTEGYRSYLNIVEDARIEKLIQRRYPGLRAPFIRSYNNTHINRAGLTGLITTTTLLWPRHPLPSTKTTE